MYYMYICTLNIKRVGFYYYYFFFFYWAKTTFRLLGQGCNSASIENAGSRILHDLHDAIFLCRKFFHLQNEKNWEPNECQTTEQQLKEKA